MKTTVIIPNYNGKKFMEPCMAALKKQTEQDFCVLIVDNGSTDGSLEWMAENLPGLVTVQKGEKLPRSSVRKQPENLSHASDWTQSGKLDHSSAGKRQEEAPPSDLQSSGEDGSRSRAPYPFPVYLLPLPENTGFSGAVNLGIRMASTEYVILLNNDTEVDRAYIREMERSMTYSPRVFSVSSKMIQMFHPELMDDAGDLYTVIGWGFQRGVGQKSTGYRKPCRVFTACAGAAIYRRSVFDEIGLFDELHFAYLEDLDVGYRARIAGYENWYCPTAIVYHYGSGTSGSKYNPFKVRLAARNSVYLNYKNMPFLQLLVNAIPLAVGYAIKTRFFIKQGFGAEYKAGLREGVATLYQCRRVKFRPANTLRYLRIELELIGNTAIYGYEYAKRRLLRR